MDTVYYRQAMSEWIAAHPYEAHECLTCNLSINTLRALLARAQQLKDEAAKCKSTTT